MRRIPAGVTALLIANIAMFVAWMFTPRPPFVPGRIPEPDAMTGQFALWFPDNPHFEPWQFLTHMFMHGGPAHIFFNMFALFMFGSLLERLWGTRKLVTFFLVCGLGAGLIQTGADMVEYRSLQAELVEAGVAPHQITGMLKTEFIPAAAQTRETLPITLDLLKVFHRPMVGASGAVYGVLVAFGLLFPNAKLMLIFLPVPIAAKYLIPILLLLDIVGAVTGSFSLFGATIAHFAHLGGALIGFLLMMFWRQQARARAAAAAHPFDVIPPT